MKYFYNKKITEITLPEQGYKVSTDFNEKNVHVSMTPEQLAFYEENQTATAYEVFNCKLNEVPKIVELSAEDLFNPEIALIDVISLFENKLIGLEGAYFIIKENTELKNFSRLNIYTSGLCATGKVTQEDLDNFREIYMFQNIDLTKY